MTHDTEVVDIEERFTTLDNCQHFPLANYSGVYFLRRDTTIVYVGKAKNLARRVIAHMSNKEFDTVLAMQVPEEMLHPVETHWIRQLRPVLNRFLPGRRFFTRADQKAGRSASADGKMSLFY
jgi:excinuclease UvrABC nuclease subunit